MKKLCLIGAVAALLAGTAQAGPVLWINDSAGRIGKIDVATGDVTVVGNSGAGLTDIAFDPSGNLYGVSFNTFYSINTATGLATSIGSLGLNGANALVFSTSGVAYTMGFNSTSLYSVNVGTGQATNLGDVGYQSAGDLAFHNGSLFLASDTNQLVEVGLSPVGGSAVGSYGVSNMFGLANGDNNVLYGVAGTSVYSIDALTGAATFVLNYGGKGLGQAYGQAFFYEAAPAVPEPSAFLLMAVGLAAPWALRRRLRHRAA